MLVFLYEVISALMLPVWILAGLLCRIRTPRRTGLMRQRLGLAWGPRPRGPVIWGHGASIGEARSLLAVMTQVLDRDPDLLGVITVQNEPALQALIRLAPERIQVRFAPYDTPWAVWGFLRFWRPIVFLVAENELWPCLFAALARRRIPCFALNFRLSAKSLSFWTKMGGALTQLYRPFQALWTNKRDFAGRFCQLTGLSVQVTPSLKYFGACQAFAAKENSETDPTKHSELSHARRPLCWMASCLHPAEEALIVDTHRQLVSQFPTLCLICAPRSSARVIPLQEAFTQVGFEVQTLSTLSTLVGGEHGQNLSPQNVLVQGAFSQSTPPGTSCFGSPHSVRPTPSTTALKPTSLWNWQVLMIDQFGQLDFWYQQVPVVALCGAFYLTKRHNVLEPLAQGAQVIQGAGCDLTQDVVQDLLDLQQQTGVQVFHVVSAQDLAATVKGLLETPGLRDQTHAVMEPFFADKQHQLQSQIHILIQAAQRRQSSRHERVDPEGC